ncbi:MAG TPA: PAS domain S-box protein [Lacunisphaera sp.]|nr:PAS domain S-box protein [Lacunisphaera sp.]
MTKPGKSAVPRAIGLERLLQERDDLLRLELERLTLALEATRASIWDFDVGRGVIAFDSAWQSMLGGGSGPSQMSLRELFDRIHPADWPGASEAVNRCLAGRQDNYDQEYRVRTAAGEWRWLLGRGRVSARDTAGRALRMVGTHLEITRRKDVEEAAIRDASFFASLNQLTLSLLRRQARQDVLNDLAAKAVALFGEKAQLEIALVNAGNLIAHRGDGRPCGLIQPRSGRSGNEAAWRAVDSRLPVAVRPSSPSGTTESAADTDIVFIPILLDARALGVLGLTRPGSEPPFTNEELAKGMLLAQLAALVIHNAGIYEDAVHLAAKRAADIEDREQRYRQIVENINQGFYTANRRSLFTYANPAISIVTGKTPEELVGSSSFRFVAAPDRERIIALYREWAAGTQRHGSAEFRIAKPDGSLIWVEQVTQIIRRTDGKIAEYRNFLRDITKRKAAEEALRASESKFRSVFDNSPIPIVLFSQLGGTVVEVNRAAERTFGYDRTEALGRTTLELNIWADLADRDRYMDLIKRHGSFHGAEMRMRNKGGAVITLLCNAGIVWIGDQQCLLNSFIDITAQKEAEAALRESEVRFRTLADVAPVGIFRADPAGLTTFVNRRWCELAGMSLADAHGDRWVRAIHAEDRQRVIEGWAQAVRAGTSSTAEYRFQRPDGTIVHLVGHSLPQTDCSGQVIGHVGTITDITSLQQAEASRRQAEAQLRQAQKMESLGTLAGGIAHDFNNILTGLLGYAQLARMDLAEGHPANAWLDNLAVAGNRARGLVQQILTFSRKKDGQIAPLQLHPVLQDACSLLRSTLPAMIDLRQRIDPGCPPVMADGTQIHQIVMNLCTNALHALPPEHGWIEVGLQCRELTAKLDTTTTALAPGRYAVLSVADNGHGMTPEVLARIFEPFFTTKESGKGTGLGLAVVHGIVQSHGGAVTVQSAPGAGARFEIFLPALTPAPADGTLSAAAGPLPRGRGQRILFVDDDTLAGPVICRLIRTLGYRTTEFSNPRDALVRFAAAPEEFDLVVTDLAMPDLPGDQLAAQLLALRPNVPIILLTGYLEPGRQSALQRAGIRLILGKPPEIELLATGLARLLPA